MAKNRCKDCGANIYKTSIRCHKCANFIITRSFVGKSLTLKHKSKLKSSWNYSKHITLSWRKKQSELRKGIPVTVKGSKWSKKQRENIMKERINRDPQKEINRRIKLSETHLGEKAYQWKGGRTIRNGYTWILTDEKGATGKRKYKFEHRIVMEKHLGRLLTPEEQVHHIDKNRSNNDITNLMLFPNAKAHTDYHHLLDKNKKEE